MKLLRGEKGRGQKRINYPMAGRESNRVTENSEQKHGASRAAWGGNPEEQGIQTTRRIGGIYIRREGIYQGGKG